MAAMRGQRLQVGSGAWIADERNAAFNIAQSEVEEFSYSARNELDWLNEHMAGIFNENETYVCSLQLCTEHETADNRIETLQRLLRHQESFVEKLQGPSRKQNTRRRVWYAVQIYSRESYKLTSQSHSLRSSPPRRMENQPQ